MKVHCAHDKLVQIAELNSHPKNRNKHPEEQIIRLAQILEYQGWRYPVKVSKRSGFVTSGHGRIEAAKLNGWAEVPVNFQDYESDEQEIADVTADNAIALWSELDLSGINADLADLGPDFDIDLLGIEDFVLEPAEKFEAQSDEDEVPENVDTRAKPGDIWQLGRHRLMCGDSTNIRHVETLMNGEKADMVFTDPPYGIGFQIGQTNEKLVNAKSIAEKNPIKNDENLIATKDAFAICKTMNIGAQIWWGASYYPSILEDGKKWVVWDKNHNSDWFSSYEFAFTTLEGKTDHFKHTWQGMIKESERGDKRLHPTQKPIALAEWCFENYGDPKTVLDLFGGSGSTLIACEKTNRKCFMMEIDPHYCDVILARWEKYTGKLAERIVEGESEGAA